MKVIGHAYFCPFRQQINNDKLKNYFMWLKNSFHSTKIFSLLILNLYLNAMQKKHLNEFDRKIATGYNKAIGNIRIF